MIIFHCGREAAAAAAIIEEREDCDGAILNKDDIDTEETSRMKEEEKKEEDRLKGIRNVVYNICVISIISLNNSMPIPYLDVLLFKIVLKNHICSVRLWRTKVVEIQARNVRGFWGQRRQQKLFSVTIQQYKLYMVCTKVCIIAPLCLSPTIHIAEVLYSIPSLCNWVMALRTKL